MQKERNAIHFGFTVLCNPLVQHAACEMGYDKILKVQITENSGSWLYHEKILKHRHIPSELLIYFLRTQALVIATNLILVNI